MIIEGPFYRLTSINDSSPRFDLELLYDIGGNNPRQEFKIEGYGYPLESAIERCICYAVSKNLKSPTTLKAYLNEYKIQKEKIRCEILGDTRNSI